MAILNKEEGCVILRIVYAGAPLSGKTESLRALSALLFGEQRGEKELYSPDHIDGRTLYFDWLNYTGGYFRGYKVNCQLISVPGQKTLQSRRKLLLEMADVVVFVVDSEVDRLSIASKYYQEMLPWLNRGDEPPVGIVIQANKRDSATAAAMPIIYETFQDNLNILVMETIATKNTGIREAFVTGVKIGLERASWLLDNNKINNGPSDLISGKTLLKVIKTQESKDRRLRKQRIQCAKTKSKQQQTSNTTIDLDLSAAQLHQLIHDNKSNKKTSKTVSQMSTQAVTVDSIFNLASGQISEGILNDYSSIAQAKLSMPSVFDLHDTDRHNNYHADMTNFAENNTKTNFIIPAVPNKDIAAGSVFPPISGRIILHKLANDEPIIEQMPNGDWQATMGNQWRLLNRCDECFSSSSDARVQLLRYANTHKKIGALLSEHRCIAIVESEQQSVWRIWQVVRNEMTLYTLLNNALMDFAPQRIAEKVYIIAEKFLDACYLFLDSGMNLSLDMHYIALHHTKPIFTGYINNKPTETTALSVLDILEQNFQQPIRHALQKNSALTLGAPYILHPFEIYAKTKPKNQAMIDVLRRLFIGEH